MLNAQVPSLMKDVNTGIGTFTGSEAGNLLNYNGEMYFTGYDNTGPQLFKTDGSAENTVAIVPLVYASGFIEFNGKLYFSS